jgi:hypothetical protein
VFKKRNSKLIYIPILTLVITLSIAAIILGADEDVEQNTYEEQRANEKSNNSPDISDNIALLKKDGRKADAPILEKPRNTNNLTPLPMPVIVPSLPETPPEMPAVAPLMPSSPPPMPTLVFPEKGGMPYDPSNSANR